MGETDGQSAVVLVDDSAEGVKSFIHVVRGQQIILDSDLAMCTRWRLVTSTEQPPETSNASLKTFVSN